MSRKSQRSQTRKQLGNRKVRKSKTSRTLAKRRGVTRLRKTNTSRANQKNTEPQTAQQYSARAPRFQDLWNRVVSVISKLRSQGASLRQTSREVGVSPRTVIRYGGSALRKGTSGRYEAKKRDRLLRMLVVPTHEGPREIALRDSRQASVLGKYWSAVHRYLATGNSYQLENFEGKHIITAEGQKVALLTDVRDLDRMGSAGVLSFESLYGRTA